MIEASVLISTYNHVDTIRRAILSVLAQTEQSFEILVVGDGAPLQTTLIMQEFCAKDSRIHFFPFAKGEGHGEAYRHEVLKQAQGKIVCYLGDDDLWLPDHLKTMQYLLQQYDFVQTLHTEINPEGKISAYGGSLDSFHCRNYMLQQRWNFFGPTCAAHTLKAYRRLPYGWRPRPDGMLSDLYMWRQWLEQPWCKFHSDVAITTLHFPSPQRLDKTLVQRCAEMDHWLNKLSNPGLSSWLTQQVIRSWQQSVYVVSAEYCANTATQFANLGAWKQAIYWFQCGVELYPNNGWLQNGLSHAFGQVGQLSESLIAAQCAVKYLPDVVVIRLHLANILLAIENLDEAIQQYLKIIERDNQNHEAFHGISHAYSRKCMLNEAIYYGINAVQTSTNIFHYLLHVANLFVLQENWGDAECYFKQALAVDKQNSEARRGVINTLMRQQNYAEAEQWMYEFIQ